MEDGFSVATASSSGIASESALRAKRGEYDGKLTERTWQEEECNDAGSEECAAEALLAEGCVGDVFAWGVAEGVPMVFEKWRRLRVRRIRAGYGSACLVGEGELKWLVGNYGEDVPPGVVECAFGERHAVCIDAWGRVWVCGEGWSLGLGDRLEARKWTRLEVPWRATSVACGSRHTVVSTSCGDVFAWGRGLEGQTGHGGSRKGGSREEAIMRVETSNAVPKPRLVASLCAKTRGPRDPIVKVSCGHNFTLALTRGGKLWSWGEGRCGELGVGARMTLTRTPTRVAWQEVGEPCVDLACGWAHAIAIDAAGHPFAWGFNRFGQLGLGALDENGINDDPFSNGTYEFPKSGPTCAPPPAPATSDSLVFEGQPPATQPMEPYSVLSPTLVLAFEGRRVIKVAATAHASAAIDSAGRLYTWGKRIGSHTCRPTRVANGMSRAKISEVALTSNATFALAPAVVCSVEPRLLPMSGGKVLLRGHGFWDSGEFICISFRASDRFEIRSAAFVECDKHGLAGAQADLPPGFAASSSALDTVVCEVSFNGKDFTNSECSVWIYEEPKLTQVTPNCCNNSGKCPLDIKAAGFNQIDRIDQALVRVRFTLRGEPAVILPGQVFAHEDDEAAGAIICCSSSPQLAVHKLPASLGVSVALNGQDYVDLAIENEEIPIFTIHDARVGSATPDCVPLISTLTSRSIRLSGRGFFDHAAITARFSHQDMSASVGGRFVSETAVEVVPPIDFFEVDSLSERSVSTCSLDLSVDGGRTFVGSLPFAFYIQPSPDDLLSVQPAIGPSRGSTRVALSLNPDFHKASYSCSLVRISSLDDDYEPFSAVSRATVHDGRIVFHTPPASLEKRAPPPAATLLPDQEADDGDGSEEATEDDQELRLSTSLEIALDGIHFSPPFRIGFQYYETPILTSAELNADTNVVVLIGQHFHREANCQVQLGDAPAFCLVSNPDATITFSAPEQNINVPLHVRVSFNDGSDFTSDDVMLMPSAVEKDS